MVLFESVLFDVDDSDDSDDSDKEMNINGSRWKHENTSKQIEGVADHRNCMRGPDFVDFNGFLELMHEQTSAGINKQIAFFLY